MSLFPLLLHGTKVSLLRSNNAKAEAAAAEKRFEIARHTVESNASVQDALQKVIIDFIAPPPSCVHACSFALQATQEQGLQLYALFKCSMIGESWIYGSIPSQP